MCIQNMIQTEMKKDRSIPMSQVPKMLLKDEMVKELAKTATVGKYEKLGIEVGKLVDEKNAAYGDSFHRSADFLKILYPTGILPEQYIDALCIVRIFDKLMRIATKKTAFGESPYRDISGYGLLGLDNDNIKS